MKRLGMLFILLLPLLSLGQVAGFWQGMLHISKSDSLTLLLAVKQQGDSLYAELDSPDQYTTGIPVNSISFRYDTMRWRANTIAASYRGAYNALTDEITGEFKQGRGKLPLTLHRVGERMELRRPQTPRPPFPYTVEDDIRLQYEHPSLGKIPITGTLTYPDQKSDFNHNLLILISGSGWQDRDESIMGHQPFAVIADYFTRKGYAVFRYDDLPKAYFVKSSTRDFADVAKYVVDYFSNNENFKEANVGLIGHSEGGSIAMMVAAEDKNVDFVVSLAGMMTSAKSTLLYQLDALSKADSSFTADEIQKTLQISGQLYSTIEKAKNAKEAVDQSGRLLRNYSAQMNDAQKEKYNLTQSAIFGILQTVGSKWFFELFKLDMPKYLKKVKCPVLALNGEQDLQVEWGANFALMKQCLPKKTNFESISYPKLNHLFQHCESGLPDEYGKLEETFSEKVLQDMDFWMNEHFVR